jgi:hypothetical protein
MGARKEGLSNAFRGRRDMTIGSDVRCCYEDGKRLSIRYLVQIPILALVSPSLLKVMFVNLVLCISRSHPPRV